MSHFFTLVIVPSTNVEDAVDSVVEELLAPYDEGIVVAPYDKQCYCVGDKAEDEVRAQIEQEFGSMNDLRKQFSERHPGTVEIEQDNADAVWAEYEVLEKIWDKEVGNPIEKREKELLAVHPLRYTPDPECGECHGKGTYVSQYNKNSRWDWYSIGGRWGDIDPRRAPAIQFLEHIPYAIVTPDGKWNAKGEMGWFGMSHGEEEDWPETAKAILNQYANNIAVVCDLHI